MPKRTLTETKLFPIVLHREGDTWGYFAPGMGGGGAASQQDALRQARVMLEEEFAGLLEAGVPMPDPGTVSESDRDGGEVAWLEIEVSDAAERIAITLPKTLLAKLDAATGNRSGFIAEAVRERLGGS
ncbi:MAG: type II toxin-antitoxin system HicB family antitoxin [Pseudomonadota bacterium]